MAAYVAAAGLDPHRYLSATEPADVMVFEAVAQRVLELRAEAMGD